MTNQNEKRLYIEYNKGLGVWCIYNIKDPSRLIPLSGYTDENNELQRKGAQEVCDIFEWASE